MWSACPKRKHNTTDHESVCVGGKLFLFFAKYVVGKRSRHNVSIIEKFDIQSHIEGKSVQWEDFYLPSEQMNLIQNFCHMAPISNSEIVFLSFDYKQDPDPYRFLARKRA